MLGVFWRTMMEIWSRGVMVEIRKESDLEDILEE